MIGARPWGTDSQNRAAAGLLPGKAFAHGRGVAAALVVTRRRPRFGGNP